jgi:hypothetical protein
MTPGAFGSLAEVVDKKPEDVQEGRSTDPLKEDQKVVKNWDTIPYGTRPPCTSLEFAPFLESVVRMSKGPQEAARRMGYHQTGVILHHMKKLGIKRPVEWSRRPGVRLQRQSLVPGVAITSDGLRAWVGALIQAECCIHSHYVKKTDSTNVDITIGMTDPAPVIKFAKLYGLPGPSRPKNLTGHRLKPIWVKDISGVRAYRVLREVLPHLYGEKERGRESAILL